MDSDMVAGLVALAWLIGALLVTSRSIRSGRAAAAALAARHPAKLALVTAFGLACVTACRRPVDVTGLYASRTDTHQLSRSALFFPCDSSETVWQVQDSALAARYSAVAEQPGEWVFAHLEGLPEDSGSIYGIQHYFRVRRILEVRLRAPGDCPDAWNTFPAQLSNSADGR